MVKRIIAATFTTLACAVAWGQSYPVEGLTPGPLVGQDGWIDFSSTLATNTVVDDQLRSPFAGSTQSIRVRGHGANVRVKRKVSDGINSGQWEMAFDIYFETLGTNAGLQILTPDAVWLGRNQLFQPLLTVAPNNRANFQAFFDADGLGGTGYVLANVIDPNTFTFAPQTWYRISYVMNFDEKFVSTFKVFSIDGQGNLTEVATNDTLRAFFQNDAQGWIDNFGDIVLRQDATTDVNGFNFDNFSMRRAGGGPQTFRPSAFNIVRGALEAGDLAAILTSDDVHLRVRNGAIALPAESPITIDFVGTSPSAAASALSVKVENRVSIAGLAQRIQMRRYEGTPGFVQVDELIPAPTTDTVRNANAPSPQADFIQDSDRAVTARLLVRANGPLFTNTWRTNVDQVEFSVTP